MFLITRIGLCDHADWLGKSEMHRAGCQEGQAGNLWQEQCCSPQVEFLPPRGNLNSVLKAFQLMAIGLT